MFNPTQLAFPLVDAQEGFLGRLKERLQFTFKTFSKPSPEFHLPCFFIFLQGNDIPQSIFGTQRTPHEWGVTCPKSYQPEAVFLVTGDWNNQVIEGGLPHVIQSLPESHPVKQFWLGIESRGINLPHLIK